MIPIGLDFFSGLFEKIMQIGVLPFAFLPD